MPAAIATIRAKGKRPGIVVNPETPLDRARPFLPLVDYVLSCPSTPASAASPSSPPSSTRCRQLRPEGFPGPIEIDGGINATTAPLAIAAGARILVAGNAVFGATDRAAAIRTLRGPG